MYSHCFYPNVYLATHSAPLPQALSDEDGITLRPAEPGRLMAHHCISLNTMLLIVQTPGSAGMVQLLRVLAQASEFENLRLRR